MDANEQAERAAKRADALKDAKTRALMDPPDLEPLRALAAIEEAEIRAAVAAADLAEEVAKAKTARAALKAMKAAQPYTVDASKWDPGEPPDAVVSVTTSKNWTHPAMRRGEVAALGGAGGSGKSYLALGLCGAAAGGGGRYAGFDVASGPALVWSREGGAEVAVRRLKRIGASKNVHVVASPRALIREADGGLIQPVPREWNRLADTSERLQPALILIDPALSALDIENPDAPRPVRRAIEHFEDLARDAEAAVLMIHHSTKAARYGAAALKNMHPDAVAAHALAGSREWFDSPRAAFFMFGLGEGRTEVLCVKANAARPGWCVRMEPCVAVEGKRRVFEGWKRLARLDPDQRAENVSQEQGGKGGARRGGKRKDGGALDVGDWGFDP